MVMMVTYSRGVLLSTLVCVFSNVTWASMDTCVVITDESIRYFLEGTYSLKTSP